MIKKFSVMVALAVAIIFSVSQSQAAAEEVYVGNYSDGSNVYLLTHTIVIKNGGRQLSFNCRVRAGYDYLDYYFYRVNGSPYYQNSEGYHGFANPEQSPVAWNIYRYVSQHF